MTRSCSNWCLSTLFLLSLLLLLLLLLSRSCSFRSCCRLSPKTSAFTVLPVRPRVFKVLPVGASGDYSAPGRHSPLMQGRPLKAARSSSSKNSCGRRKINSARKPTRISPRRVNDTSRFTSRIFRIWPTRSVISRTINSSFFLPSMYNFTLYLKLKQ